ncbi:hypothetical protein AVEN_99332-1 [Araneus ventricosus]|uniref:Peptidase A2 domain-containing protein n=1 Tax=Araneus ventricosus TaxID=182803 RepID=A0A4Y2GCW1_ARAVE|nr:hypothetical protein AVEN_99332-1 [Araneus ventricosus]
MLVDTGANVTLLRTDLAQKLKEQLIYTAPNISLKTATGEKTEIRGKLDASIECGSRKFHHRIYVADITDPCILGLDFLQKFNFTVDLEKNEIRTGGEEIPLFSASVQHSKSCSVLAKKRTIIPARSECLIQGVPEVPGQFRYAVTNFPSQVSQKGVLVAATLVDLEMEAIPVSIGGSSGGARGATAPSLAKVKGPCPLTFQSSKLTIRRKMDPKLKLC